MAVAAVITAAGKGLGASFAGIRLFHRSSALSKSIVAGKYKPTKNRTKPLTYEQANPPYAIAHRKSWNSWNTACLEPGERAASAVIDDAFIRKFMNGTFHNLIKSEVIIKRQYNIIRISAVVVKRMKATKIAFLTGYTEEMLGYWFQCIVKLELQYCRNPEATVFKYI